MEKLADDIYLYEKSLKSSSEKPLILVHPWYDEGNNPFFVYSRASGSGVLSRANWDYRKNLDFLLTSSSERNVFLFEVFPVENVLLGCEKIAEKRGPAGLYGICTKERDSLPKHSFQKDIFDFIRNFSRDVDLAGGYIRKFDSGYRGCAGSAYSALLKSGFNVDLVEDCCFG